MISHFLIVCAFHNRVLFSCILMESRLQVYVRPMLPLSSATQGMAWHGMAWCAVSGHHFWRFHQIFHATHTPIVFKSFKARSFQQVSSISSAAFSHYLGTITVNCSTGTAAACATFFETFCNGSHGLHWPATDPIDVRAGTETAIAKEIAVFSAAKPHCAYREFDSVSTYQCA